MSGWVGFVRLGLMIDLMRSYLTMPKGVVKWHDQSDGLDASAFGLWVQLWQCSQRLG